MSENTKVRYRKPKLGEWLDAQAQAAQSGAGKPRQYPAKRKPKNPANTPGSPWKQIDMFDD